MRATARHFSTASQIAVSALWFAWFAQWMAIPVVLVQNQVFAIVGPRSTHLEAATGAILAAGAVIALFIPPLAGALSDRSEGSRGRRRPFLIQGVLLSSVALVLLGLFRHGGSLLLYALAYLNLQFWWNWAAGPYAGMIPDVVPQERHGMASGWMNVLSILGVIVGNVLMLLLYRPGHNAPVIAAFIAINLTALLATLYGVREPPAPRARARRSFPQFFRSFWLPLAENAIFYLVLATRLFMNLGIWSVLAFLLFYMQSVLGLSAAAASRLFPALLGVGGLIAIPASLAGVKAAERFGLVRITVITSWVMAVATFCYVPLALAPAVVLIVPVLLVFSAANGAYGAVDWYLALRVLPRGADAGKDFGIWHVSMVLPQIVGPLSMGVLISAVKGADGPRIAYALAFGIAAFWFLLGAFFVRRVRLAPQ